jgi:hypothetical protein
MRWIGLLVLAIGCSQPPPAQTARDCPPPAKPTELQASYDAFGRPLAASTAATIVVPERWETRSLGDVAPAAPLRPRTHGKRDIQLRNARLDNALRMIASEGGFNLVVEGDLTAPVTVELHAVDPYDALLALAEANGVHVRYEHDIVVVGSRERAAAPAD